MINFSIVCILVLFNTIHCQIPIRDTVYGKIRGFVSTRGIYPVEQYLGVPYARPPVGDLRFENPEDPLPWSDTLNTTMLPPACLQGKDIGYVIHHKPEFNESHQSEDCLYLNIYVPKVSTTTELPILFYIHGGSNRAGMGAMLDGDILAAYGEIIVVTFNYRLGFLGFLAYKDEDLNGNYGLLDQLHALKWVYNNIRIFGGNPNRITVQGHSAGAGNVGLLIASPLSKGLFQHAIIHSGSPLSFWCMADQSFLPGTNINEQYIDMFWDMHENESYPSFKTLLKSITQEDIASLWKRLIMALPRSIVYLPAVVDGYYLTESPEDSFSKGHFHGESFLLAFTDDEELTGPISVSDLASLARFYPTICHFEDTIESVYADKDDSSNVYIEAEADMVFFSSMMRVANYITKWINDTYIFDYAYLSPNTKNQLNVIPHGADLFYLFGAPITGHASFTYTEIDVNISMTVMKLWSNFVKYGYLTMDGENALEHYDNRTMFYHRLSSDGESINLRKQKNFRLDKMLFWNHIVPNIVCYPGSSCTMHLCDFKFTIMCATFYLFYKIAALY